MIIRLNILLKFLLIKLPLILLIFIFLLDSISPNVSFLYNKQKIHKEMKRLIKHNLNQKDIEFLKIYRSEIENKSLFKWIHSKEFRYRGAMYDIVDLDATIETKEYYIFKVINDVREELLLKDFIDGIQGKPYSGLLNKIKLFLFDAVYLNNSYKYIPIFFEVDRVDKDFIKNTYKPSIDSPPPKKYFQI
jgi:hypothetical protein